MTHEFIVAGIMIHTIVPAVLLALALTVVIARILIAAHFYRLVLARPLVELCIFLIILGLIVTYLPDGVQFG